LNFRQDAFSFFGGDIVGGVVVRSGRRGRGRTGRRGMAREEQGEKNPNTTKRLTLKNEKAKAIEKHKPGCA
jgi:hypothetical protein